MATTPTEITVGEIDEARIFARRAEQLARRLEEKSDSSVIHAIAVVSCGSEKLGIPAHWLRELLAIPDVAPLPGLPAWMPGITHVRGELMSVVDLARWMGLATSQDPTVVAVLEGARGPLGVSVGEVLTFRNVLAHEIVETFDTHHLRPIVATTHDLVTIVDIGRLFADEALVVEARRHTPLE